MFRFIALFVILMFVGSIYGQRVSYAYCHEKFTLAQDDSLKVYLTKFEKSNLSELDELVYRYFYSLASRYDVERVELLENLYRALEIGERIKNDSLQAFVLDELSVTLQKGGELDLKDAFKMIDQSIVLKKELNDLSHLGKSYLIKGNAFYYNENVNNNLDSALYYYQRSLGLVEKESLYFLNLKNIATIDLSKGDFGNVEERFKQCLRFEKENQRETASLTTTLNLASLYLKLNRFEESKYIIDTIHQYLIDEDIISFYRGDVLHLKAMFYDSLGDYKKSSVLKDSILDYQHTLMTEANLEAQQKYKSVSLESQLSKKHAKHLQAKLWVTRLGALSVGLAFLIFGLRRFYSLKKLASEKELETTKIRAAFEATRAKMEGEQLERQSIASVLHDQMASMLTAASLHLSIVKKDKNVNPSVKKVDDILKDVSQQVRDISHQLVSPALLKFGLDSAIDSMVDNISSSEKRINFESKLEGERLERTKEIFLYRSCAELINNAMKHSNGDQIWIRLFRESNDVVLKVEDNGSGFNKEQTNGSSLGIAHIKNRAEAFMGFFNLEAIGQRTVATLKIQ